MMHLGLLPMEDLLQLQMSKWKDNKTIQTEG